MRWWLLVTVAATACGPTSAPAGNAPEGPSVIVAEITNNREGSTVADHRVHVDTRPFCDPDPEDTSELDSEPVDRVGVPAFAQWYEHDDVQAFVRGLSSGAAGLEAVHGAWPHHGARTVQVAVNSQDVAVLDDVAATLRQIAAPSVRASVRPTCVDAAETERLKQQLQQADLPWLSMATVHPMTGHLQLSVHRGREQDARNALAALGTRPEMFLIASLGPGDLPRRTGGQ